MGMSLCTLGEGGGGAAADACLVLALYPIFLFFQFFLRLFPFTLL